MNKNGLISIRAKDRTTGASNGIQIKNVTNGRCQNRRLQKMILRASKYCEAEPKRKKMMTIRCNLQKSVNALNVKLRAMEHKLPNIKFDEKFQRLKGIQLRLRVNPAKFYDQDEALEFEVQAISTYFDEMDESTRLRKGRLSNLNRY